MQTKAIYKSKKNKKNTWRFLKGLIMLYSTFQNMNQLLPNQSRYYTTLGTFISHISIVTLIYQSDTIYIICKLVNNSKYEPIIA